MTKTKTAKRKIRHKRVRAKVKGTLQRPRLFVYKSNKHIYCGLADDTKGHVLMSFSDKKLSGKKEKINADTNIAKKVGKEFGKLAIKEGYRKVIFDRGGYKYHGKVKALAEGAREAGLKF
ncbi:MAG: 50S ribosomal protein L18 [Candidatus Spechtbacterales bacterium]|nr:50S ribosomal protein L18 [Candidatus Spechtbacterales bacterium]